MKIKYLIPLFLCAFLFSSCNRQSKVSGDVFIRNDRNEVQKLGAVQIKFFSKSQIDEIKARNEKPDYENLIPIGRTTSNSDGKFEVNLPHGEYIVTASTSVRDEYSPVNYNWEVNLNLREAEKSISLNDTNAQREFVRE